MTYGTRRGAGLVAGACGRSWALPSGRSRRRGTWPILFWRSVGMVPVLLAFIAWPRAASRCRDPQRRDCRGDRRASGWCSPLPGRSMRSRPRPSPMRCSCSPPRPSSRRCWAGCCWANGCAPRPGRPSRWPASACIVMVREGLATGALAGNLAALLSAVGFARLHASRCAGARWTTCCRRPCWAASFRSLRPGWCWRCGAKRCGAFGAGTSALRPAMGAVLLALGMVLYTLGSRVVPAAELTLLSMVEVMLGPLWVWLFLGETASAGHLCRRRDPAGCRSRGMRVIGARSQTARAGA